MDAILKEEQSAGISRCSVTGNGGGVHYLDCGALPPLLFSDFSATELLIGTEKNQSGGKAPQSKAPN